MKIALIGYGSTGKAVHEATKFHSAIEITCIHASKNPISENEVVEADVIVDFSIPNAVLHNVKTAAFHKKSIVIGTTGWHNELQTVKNIVNEAQIGCIYGSNFSIGANLIFEITRFAAKIIEKANGYDVGILETHHRNKIDSPSGTAIKIAKIIMKEMAAKTEINSGNPEDRIKKNELQISSSRIGSVYGQHQTVFDCEYDTITISHTAKSRLGFASGALKAAEWIRNKRGMFDFSENFMSILNINVVK